MVNSYPPLGLGYLAAVMEDEGHTVAIFDLGLEPDTPLEQGVERIVSYGPDLIGVTAMTNNYHSAEKTISLLKARMGCPIILGGPHATVFPERVASDPHVDYVVYGEGEETLAELTRAIERGWPCPSEEVLRGIKGLCFSCGDDVIRNPARPLIKDLNALPLPARHLFDLSRYPLYAANGERMVTLLSSRGCPYNCSYCFKGIVGRTYRQRSPDSVVGEIRHLVEEYGYRNFYFIDDLFTLSRRRVTAICHRLIEESLVVRWQCLTRVDRVTPDLLNLMYQAGCREVHMGIESGNPEILRRLGKDIAMEQVRQAVRWTAEAGILAKGYFMLGLPGDTEETMKETIRFASELPLDQAMFSLTTPFPGTRMWDDLVNRYPEITFNQDFSQAYYYARYDHTVKPFLNVSEVSDECLSQLVLKAQTRFQEAKRKRKYVRSLGPVVGRLLYRLSTSGPIRRIGHAVLRAHWLREKTGSVKGLGALGDYDVRQEYAQRWN